MTDTDSYLHWGRASLTRDLETSLWVLSVPSVLEDRAARIFARTLLSELRENDDGVAVQVIPAQWQRDERRVGVVDFGEVSIACVDFEATYLPGLLRGRMDALASSAVEQATKEQAYDEAVAARYVGALREG